MTPGSATDRFGHHLGLRSHRPRADQPVVTLEVTDHHLNGAGIAHGGVLFSALDQAIAIVANDAQPGSVLSTGTIYCHRPALAGDHLEVFVTAIKTGRRLSVYEGRVMCESRLIATMVGQTMAARSV